MKESNNSSTWVFSLHLSNFLWRFLCQNGGNGFPVDTTLPCELTSENKEPRVFISLHRIGLAIIVIASDYDTGCLKKVIEQLCGCSRTTPYGS